MTKVNYHLFVDNAHGVGIISSMSRKLMFRAENRKELINVNDRKKKGVLSE